MDAELCEDYVNFHTRGAVPDFMSRCMGDDAKAVKAKAKILKSTFLRKTKQYEVVAGTRILMRIGA